MTKTAKNSAYGVSKNSSSGSTNRLLVETIRIEFDPTRGRGEPVDFSKLRRLSLPVIPRLLRNCIMHLTK